MEGDEEKEVAKEEERQGKKGRKAGIVKHGWLIA